jgi:hypothetical protein
VTHYGSARAPHQLHVDDQSIGHPAADSGQATLRQTDPIVTNGRDVPPSPRSRQTCAIHQGPSLSTISSGGVTEFGKDVSEQGRTRPCRLAVA